MFQTRAQSESQSESEEVDEEEELPETLPFELDKEEAERIKAITGRVDAKAERMALKDTQTLDSIDVKMLEEDRSIDDKVYLHFKSYRLLNDRHNRRMKNVENTVSTSGALSMIMIRELRELQKSTNVSQRYHR